MKIILINLKMKKYKLRKMILIKKLIIIHFPLNKQMNMHSLKYDFKIIKIFIKNYKNIYKYFVKINFLLK